MMIKHVGRHGDRKVAILFREVPGEEHMALVVYPDVLPKSFHDSIMRTIESTEGQNAEVFGDVLFRTLLPDGRRALETLHKEGMIKRVQASQIIVTPNAKTNIRLDELNKAINEMSSGDVARQKMEDLDANRGLNKSPRNQERQEKSIPVNDSTPSPTTASVLTDGFIARERLAQAERMELEAAGLAAEATRLKEEAYSLDATLKPKKPRVRKVKQNESTQ